MKPAESMGFVKMAGTEHMTSAQLMSVFEPILKNHLTPEHQQLLAQNKTTSLVKDVSTQDEVRICEDTS